MGWIFFRIHHLPNFIFGWVMYRFWILFFILKIRLTCFCMPFKIIILENWVKWYTGKYLYRLMRYMSSLTQLYSYFILCIYVAVIRWTSMQWTSKLTKFSRNNLVIPFNYVKWLIKLNVKTHFLKIKTYTKIIYLFP